MQAVSKSRRFVKSSWKVSISTTFVKLVINHTDVFSAYRSNGLQQFSFEILILNSADIILCYKAVSGSSKTRNR